MPDLVEQMYCSQQIHIPPTFPFILKQYSKAAIRTQPYDLLRWSAAYFRAMAQGDIPPVKERLEYPPPDTPSGLSPGYLKVLLKQIGKVDTVPSAILYGKWNGICLKEDALTDMLKLENFEEDVNWMNFIAIAAGHLSKSLTQTMYLICELLTEEPEGGNDMISFEIFTALYTFLAKLNCGTYEDEGKEKEEVNEDESGADNETSTESANKGIPGIGPVISDTQIKSVLEYLNVCAERQEGMVMPRNIHHFLCPSLDKVPVSD